MLSGRNWKKWALLTTLLASLSSCTFLNSFVPDSGKSTDVMDRQQNLTVDDFRDLNRIDKIKEGQDEATASAKLGAPPLPDIAEVLAAPRPPKVANTKLVTLAVTEDVPLRDVLFELGRLAGVDIEVGTGLDKTGINLRATDRPFNEVIERIADLGGLRYSVNGKSIRVERDEPYIKNYSLDFLNIVRSSTSGYTLSTNILSGGGGGGSSSGGGSSATSVGTSGSTSSITATADSDLWTALEASVSEILTYHPNGSPTGADAAAAGGAAAPVAAAPGAAASGSAGGSKGGNGNLVINRQAGVLSVNATEHQHEMIQRFLTMISRNSSAQVLIEAKIVEVALSDQFLSGINWTKLIGDVNHNHADFGKFSAPDIETFSNNPVVNSGTGAIISKPFSLELKGGDLDAVMSMTQRFGTTRTLSSPRLSAINNQQAILTFARNEVFFQCTAEPPTTLSTGGNTSATPTAPTVSCSQNTVPIGILLNILPSINLDTQEVTLNVRPTLTRQVGTATSPETAYIQSLLPSGSPDIPPITVPIIEVREIDSVTKVKSGGVMVIGGLMEDSTRNESTGVPGAQEIPILGNMFKSRSEDSLKHELVIFIKATIVNSDGSTHPVDRALYDKYVTDPRPLFPKNPQ